LPTYRLYRIDGAGKITSAEWIEAPDDSRALDMVRERSAGGRFELWQRERLVGSFPRRPT
jgi:hypothetical protein